MESKLKVTFYLPMHDNDGNRLDWEREAKGIAKAYGGATVLPACDGMWYDSAGKLYADLVRPVVTLVDNAPEVVLGVRLHAKALATILRQECVLVEWHETTAFFAEP